MFACVYADTQQWWEYVLWEGLGELDWEILLAPVLS